MSSDHYDWTKCSDPPEESCSDAGCPVHGGDRCPDLRARYLYRGRLLLARRGGAPVSGLSWHPPASFRHGRGPKPNGAA